MREMIPFNIPCSIGIEPDLIREAIERRHLSGNGHFTKKVHAIFEEEFGYRKVLMTNSCTAALEMAAYLCRFQPGDEVILPSFTHVGTANAFERAGATLVFADSLSGHPNLDANQIKELIGPRTKAVVVVHYAGVGCQMDLIKEVCDQKGLILIEDAAHAIGANYKGKLLGSFGHLAAYSFHETKNITSGQGGLLMINDPGYEERALRLWENGTNRAAFFRGEVDHYTWVDTGFCYLPSELNAAYLYGQLLHRDEILKKRLELWQAYWDALSPYAGQEFSLPLVNSEDGQHNGHIFYLNFRDEKMRDEMLNHLRLRNIGAVFHYIPLHNSPHFRERQSNRSLNNCENHSACILRLPLFHSLTKRTVMEICEEVKAFLSVNKQIQS